MRLEAPPIATKFRDTEVQNLRALATQNLGVTNEEYVLGLEVAMDDVACVRYLERSRHLSGDSERVPHGQRPAAPEPPLEGLALEKLHRDVRTTFILSKVEDLDDARISDGRRRARLVEEPRYALGLTGMRFVKDLNRSPPTQHRVLGEPHFTHSAGAEALEHAVRSDCVAHLHLVRLYGSSGDEVNRGQ